MAASISHQENNNETSLNDQNSELGHIPKGTRETKVEDFDFLKTIGTGTFARVYLCRHRNQKNAATNGSYYALKMLNMHDVIRLKQVDHVKNEKNILLEINHPFLVNLIWHYKDKAFLYMLFPYIR